MRRTTSCGSSQGRRRGRQRLSARPANGRAPRRSGAEPPAAESRILHSLTGGLAIHEYPVVKATELAVEEISAKGVLGRPVEKVVRGLESRTPYTFARKVREADRRGQGGRAVRLSGRAGEARRGGVRGEGSPVVLLGVVRGAGVVAERGVPGGTPNQTLVPMVGWAYTDRGKRRFLPHRLLRGLFPWIHAILKPKIQETKAEVVGERYALSDETNFTAAVEEMKKQKADSWRSTPWTGRATSPCS